MKMRGQVRFRFFDSQEFVVPVPRSAPDVTAGCALLVLHKINHFSFSNSREVPAMALTKCSRKCSYSSLKIPQARFLSC